MIESDRIWLPSSRKLYNSQWVGDSLTWGRGNGEESAGNSITPLSFGKGFLVLVSFSLLL